MPRGLPSHLGLICRCGQRRMTASIFNCPSLSVLPVKGKFYAPKLLIVYNIRVEPERNEAHEQDLPPEVL